MSGTMFLSAWVNSYSAVLDCWFLGFLKICSQFASWKQGVMSLQPN
uniref:Uncharacterized protein n=1 Tax=Anguilla anguilla TaxID=7936 RepID=A0A0E9TUN1_ANGAN